VRRSFNRPGQNHVTSRPADTKKSRCSDAGENRDQASWQSGNTLSAPPHLGSCTPPTAADRGTPSSKAPRQQTTITGRFSGLRIILLTTPSPQSATSCGTTKNPTGPRALARAVMPNAANLRMAVKWRSSPITAAGPRWICTTFPFTSVQADTGNRELFTCQSRPSNLGLDARIPISLSAVKKNLLIRLQAFGRVTNTPCYMLTIAALLPYLYVHVRICNK